MSDDPKRLLKQGRAARTDWMGDAAPIEEIAAMLAAMANSQGGTLLFGVDREGSVSGVHDAENAVDRVLQAALSIDPPLIMPLPRIAQIDGKSVIVVMIPPGMPHVYSLDGRFLARDGSANMALKPKDIRRLMFERGETSFETEIVRGATLEDIDWDKARAYVANLGTMGDHDAERALLRRGCLALQDGEARPTNAGILLFGKDPQRLVRGADITAARFGGEAMSDTFLRENIVGTLPDQIRRAETFLFDHLRKNLHLGKSMAREERFEYPMEAARELVVNAVAHRDYSIQGDGIRLFLFSDRMEVTSPGGLPGPVTIRNIKDERFSRNPVIVQVLSDMGFIERLGYGVDRVLELLKQQNLREPQFEETGGGFRVTLYRQAAITAQDDEAHDLKGEYRGIAINSRQQAAIQHLQGGNARITNSDLQSLCPDVHPETIRRDLADLVTKTILRKLGQKRGSYYVLNRD